MSRNDTTPALRAAGLRATPQRQFILQVLEASDRPLSVEEIWERMEHGRSGLPTIYRNLDRFVREGWAETVMDKDQVTRFIRCRSKGHHHHLQCERCGRMTEVETCGVDKLVVQMQAHSGFRITRHQLQLFGLCPECQ